jgi:hypothetical protein
MYILLSKLRAANDVYLSPDDNHWAEHSLISKDWTSSACKVHGISDGRTPISISEGIEWSCLSRRACYVSMNSF